MAAAIVISSPPSFLLSSSSLSSSQVHAFSTTTPALSGCRRIGLTAYPNQEIVTGYGAHNPRRGNSRAAAMASMTPVEEVDGGSTVGESEPASKILPPGSCQACGRESLLGGCNGEGRIQGGIGAIPLFSWWPIKAFRPCPEFVKVGGKYKRQGQSLDEVAFGRRGKSDDLDISERLGSGKKL